MRITLRVAHGLKTHKTQIQRFVLLTAFIQWGSKGHGTSGKVTERPERSGKVPKAELLLSAEHDYESVKTVLVYWSNKVVVKDIGIVCQHVRNLR